MNRFAVLALYAPLLAYGPLSAGKKPIPMVGAYAPLEPGSDLAREARAEIQRYFVDDRQHLADIQQASSQVVAGLNVKLVCRVTSNKKETSLWEFVIWRKLDGTWRLISAVRTSALV